MLTAGLAIPLVVVFLVKSPQPDEHLLIFGFSYYRLVFIFFLSSAIMVHVSLFFLKAKPPIILIFFGLLIFCCFPFIFGLKKNLTLSQAVVDIPFFADWPFFLKPGYVLIEFLIPLGVAAYLYLQIKRFFSRRPGNYAFLWFAIYLSIAAFLGLSGLAQARLPTMGTAIEHLIKADFIPDITDESLQDTAQVSLAPEMLEEMDPKQANVVRYAMPSLSIPAEAVKMDDLSNHQAAAINPQVTAINPQAAEMSLQAADTVAQTNENSPNMFERLSTRIDGLESQFDSLTQSLQKNGADTGSAENKAIIVELKREIQRLSDKVDGLSDAISRQTLPLAPPVEGNLEKKNEMKSLEIQKSLNPNPDEPEPRRKKY